MKVKDIMNPKPVTVGKEETVAAAARRLAGQNLGALPGCGENGRLCGMVTDRDLVIRCVAAGRNPEQTRVSEVMTGRVISIHPDTDASVAAHLMGREQVRRLPVTDNGQLCGILGLSDLAVQEENVMDAADALADITRNISPLL